MADEACRALRLVRLALLVTSACSETYSLGDGRSHDAEVPPFAEPPPAAAGLASDAALPDDAAPVGDAGLSGDAALSSAAAGARTTGFAFEPPRPIAVLAASADADDDPSLTRDLRELYFNSKRDGGKGREDIWFTTRSEAGATWAAPRPASELNSDERETGVALSADGLTLWFSSDRSGGAGGLDIYVATRPDRAAPFENLQRAQALCSAGDDLVSAVDLEALTLYLARRADEADDYDLFVARRATQGAPFQPPAPLSELNGEREESDAFAIEQGLWLVFTRSEELVLAQRDARGSYGAPSPLSDLNSEDDDRDFWTSEDLSYVVFSSDRSGSYLLYESRRRQ